MGYFEALLLGLIQGLTEFLPISSSGHLVIFGNLLNINNQGITFEVFVHFGTLLAIFFAFKDDIISILKKPFQKLTYLIIAGSIPTAIIGLTFKDIFEEMFSSLLVVGFALIITGILLWVAEMMKNSNKNLLRMRYFDAVLIGIAQAAAITPGISRSGSTIAMSLFLGVERKTAARYSFLLAIPAVLGATLLKLLDLFKEPSTMMFVGPYILGTIMATVSGYFAIKVLLKLLEERKLKYFSIYCWAVGILIILTNLIS